MTKKIDNAYLNKYTDNAIKRGYEIYDEWIDRKQDSRKIVSSAYDAMKLFKKRKTMAAFIETLAYIFAIDTHIKEKYYSLLRCLFSYFSWRRETRALNVLKSELKIPLIETDIRNLIAVQIERLAEKLEDGWDEDGDDETHGGKRNGKAEEEATEEEKEAEPTEENPEAEETADKEETKKDSEEKEELPAEEAKQEKTKEEIGETEEAAEPQEKESEVTEAYEKEEPTQEKNEISKEENSRPDVASEFGTGKKEEAKAYNYAVDSPPIYEETVRESSSKKISFIDEMVIDNMVKGDKSIIGYQRIDEAQRHKLADIPNDTPVAQNEKNISSDKDAYLYDKMIANGKGEAQQSLNAEAAKQTEKVSETKTEQPKETVQSDESVQPAEQDNSPITEIRQSDNPNADPDNFIADAINLNMSLDSKMELIRMKEEQLREHIKITLEELGMEDRSEVLRVSDPEPIKQTSITHRK